MNCFLLVPNLKAVKKIFYDAHYQQVWFLSCTYSRTKMTAVFF